MAKSPHKKFTTETCELSQSSFSRLDRRKLGIVKLPRFIAQPKLPIKSGAQKILLEKLAHRQEKDPQTENP
jgi:hypothetical protein